VKKARQVFPGRVVYLAVQARVSRNTWKAPENRMQTHQVISTGCAVRPLTQDRKYAAVFFLFFFDAN